jgi:heavy metal sensor kinase
VVVSLPIRTRLTLWYVGLLAVILLAAGTFVIVRTRADLVAKLDETLRASATELAADYTSTGGESGFRDATDASLAGLPRDESAAQLLTSDGTVAASSGASVGRRPMIDAASRASVLGGATTDGTATLGSGAGSPYRVFAMPYTRGAAPEALVVATSLADVEETVHSLLLLFMVGGVVALTAAAAGGVWLARTALSPVAKMTDQAAEIGLHELGERVAVPHTSDELHRLAVTLNSMLERLQRGVEQERRFVSDASHELRTPLAVMRSEIDVSLSAPDLTPDAREVLESAREETERMAKIVGDLLTLARLDEGELPMRREPVDLTELAARVVSTMRPLADRAEVSLELAGGSGVVVDADPARIAEVVSNLVDNAVKYSGAGGSVRVITRRSGSSGELEVGDTGPGISAESLPHVFDRFFRADPSRSRDAGGSGLGLAICREIAEAHGGRVWATSEPGAGSGFFVALPLTRQTS